MKYNVEQLLAERDSDRVSLTCSRHSYVASKIPPKPNRCKDCWLAYYVFDIASTPKALRQERIDELESVIRHTYEFVMTGKFDFVPEVNPTISYQKDGFDEVIGDYKPEITITDSETN